MRRPRGFGTLAISVILVASLYACRSQEDHSVGQKYYLDTAGDDGGDGSVDNPWKTIAKLNSIDLEPGDSVFLLSNTSFGGTIMIDSTDSGSSGHDVVITSSGEGLAVVDGGNGPAVQIEGSSYVLVRRLHLVGSGRKEGNTTNGLQISNCDHVTIAEVDIEKFQKAGLMIHQSADVLVTGVTAHDNGAAGIAVDGSGLKSDNRNITIRDSRAENNPGDPTNFTNHSGNGIVIGRATNVLIEYCSATNNGWDMPRKGNGPVGIWAYEADSVVIQYCISYRNKTSPGGEDGGGFDLDGGVTNSIIQYCLTYENQGSGFGVFQYDGASPWKNNTIRFNVSENDGLVSTAHAGFYIWNGSGDANGFTDCFIYNNTIVNESGSIIRYHAESERRRFAYYNNIFVASGSLLEGSVSDDKFLGNSWWSLPGGFNVKGEKSFARWAAAMKQETLDGRVIGQNVAPEFVEPRAGLITQPRDLAACRRYILNDQSPLRANGINLRDVPGISDIGQQPGTSMAVGASFKNEN